jgi:N-sulfoglucosamine sulfohydrolase
MSKDRPNIILLVGEDTGRHQCCYGDTYASTPWIDSLAQSGCRFTHAFSTAPVCSPSRSSLVTGRWPWSLGTHHHRSTLVHPPRLFTHELRDAGYYVNWHTKLDFNFDPPVPGTAGGFADDDCSWLSALRRGRLPRKPFFLYQNFSVTHESTMWRSARSDVWNAVDERVANDHLLSSQQRHYPDAAAVPSYLPDTPETRACLARYYDALSIQDAQIGQILESLKASPYSDNTIVIYMADHGRGLPREKRWCYDAGIHQPLIVHDPRRSAVEPGTTDGQMVSWVDMAPTILSLTGTPIPDECQGRAFLGPAASCTPRRYIFAGRDRMDEAFDHVRVARESRWHYIRNSWPLIPYAQRNHYMEHMEVTRVLREQRAEGRLSGPAALWMSETKPEEELYDVDSDPQMIHNLADSPDFAKTLMRLRIALNEHLAEVGDLGAVSERELIAQGILKDRLQEYRAFIEPLACEHRIGPNLTILEQDEARELHEQGKSQNVGS